MTTHTFRIVLAQRRRQHTYRNKPHPPQLAAAARLLSDITNTDANQCIAIINESIPFQCEFRKMVQHHETLSDCGYRAYVMTKGIRHA